MKKYIQNYLRTIFLGCACSILACCNLPVSAVREDIVPTENAVVTPITAAPPTSTPQPAPTSTPVITATPLPGETSMRQSDQMVMIYIPAGSFLMGGQDGSALPVHNVSLDAFWFDRIEVTNAMYKRCVAAGVCQTPFNLEYYDRDEFPVVHVNWYQAKAYCSWAGGNGWDAFLPSEAQWEFAARGTDGRIYPWGNDKDCSNANSGGTCGNDTFDSLAPVGSFPAGASPFGALDMTGNVGEWVNDIHAARYYETFPPDGWPVNPKGPETGPDFHVVRGGSWRPNNPLYLRTFHRIRGNSDIALDHVGFRCAGLPR